MRKNCTKCGQEKSLDDFHRDSGTKDGYRYKCKECACKSSRMWNRDNKERKSQSGKKHYESNKEYYASNTKKWREENYEKYLAYKKEYYDANREEILYKKSEYKKANRDIINRINAERRARKLNATPSWINKGCVGIFYRERQWITEAIGKEYHVDHFYPLRGKKVCGLHVESNLRIISAYDNINKGNKFDESH